MTIRFGWQSRGAVVAAAIALVALIFAGQALAEVTVTHVSTPVGASFVLTPKQFVVPVIAGTSDGESGDKVVIGCWQQGGGSLSQPVAATVAADGSFEVAHFNLYKGDQGTCQLAAIPELEGGGHAPVDLSRFTGPQVGLGGTNGFEDLTKRVVGFHFFVQQLADGFVFENAARCGVVAGLAGELDSGLNETFGCADGLGEEVDGGRAPFTVGGTVAYLPRVEQRTSPSAYQPAGPYEWHQNPLTGDTTIVEDDEVAACPGAIFPAIEPPCPEYVPLGVRLERTIEATDGGRLATITDHFISTDGLAHRVGALSSAELVLGGHGEEIELELPGGTAPMLLTEGAVLPFADPSPGTIYANVAGAPESGGSPHAAIVFDRSLAPLTVTSVTPRSATFSFDQGLDVPAGGEATRRLAFAQGLSKAEVVANSDGAREAFEAALAAEESKPPPSEPAPPSGSPASPSPAPSVATPRHPLVRITHRPRKGHKGAAHGKPRYAFRFYDEAPGATYLCGLDRRPFTACASPAVYRGLKAGPHVFRVKSVAADGEASPIREVHFRAARPKSRHPR